MESNENVNNKKKLSRARDILISVANNPRNKKFKNIRN